MVWPGSRLNQKLADHPGRLVPQFDANDSECARTGEGKLGAGSLAWLGLDMHRLA